MRKIIEGARQRTREFHSRFKEQTAAAIIAAFGFVIALAWKDVITQVISWFTPKANLFFTAILVTALSVIGIALVGHWGQQPQETR